MLNILWDKVLWQRKMQTENAGAGGVPGRYSYYLVLFEADSRFNVT